MALTRTPKGGERNQLCGCGSGLKIKKCHGNPQFQHAATNMAKGFVQLFVIQEMHDAGKLEADDCVKAVESIRTQLNKLLPECVNLETTFIDEEEQEPVVDKLQQKEEEGGTLKDLQEGTHMCGCGRRLPAGMECAKCKKGGS